MKRLFASLLLVMLLSLPAAAGDGIIWPDAQPTPTPTPIATPTPEGDGFASESPEFSFIVWVVRTVLFIS